MKIAIIDLGTNTFHLLIVESNNKNEFSELYRERLFIQLAEKGIETIGDEAYNRALNAMLHYSEIINKHQIANVTALGTAAMRRASNGKALISEIKDKTDIQIQVISGDEEARLICQGTRLAVPMTEQPVLIMDIGGGSVEFIIANSKKQFWAQSFPVGVAVLFNQFHKSDPITRDEAKSIHKHLSEVLMPLVRQVINYEFEALVGASGTFDVLENILIKEKENQKYSSIGGRDFFKILKQWEYSTLEERLAHPDIPDNRAKLIVVAFNLIEFILQLTGIENIWISQYAMKEGKIADFLKIEA